MVISPVNMVSKTHKVEISASFKAQYGPIRDNKATLKTMAAALGMALLVTLRRKCPCTRLRLASSASTKEGSPIVSALTSVS